MFQLLLIDDDPGTLTGFETILRDAGYRVVTASSGNQALNLLQRCTIHLVLSDLRLPDMSGLDVLRQVRRHSTAPPFVVVTGFATTQDAVAAMRLGAADFLEKPVFEDGLLRSVAEALTLMHDEQEVLLDVAHAQEAHAAARWARALVPIVDAPKDPRTVTGWSRLVFASPGTLRSWCRTAGISPRRSLVFARLLRVVALGNNGRHRPENLLDVVDRRTLTGLLRLAGLESTSPFPKDIDEFLKQQVIVRDPDALAEIKRALADREHSSRRQPAAVTVPPVRRALESSGQSAPSDVPSPSRQ